MEDDVVAGECDPLTTAFEKLSVANIDFPSLVEGADDWRRVCRQNCDLSVDETWALNYAAEELMTKKTPRKRQRPDENDKPVSPAAILDNPSSMEGIFTKARAVYRSVLEQAR